MPTLRAFLVPSIAAALLLGACRASTLQRAARGSCHPACPGAKEGTVADAGAVLRGELDPAAAPPAARAERAPSNERYVCPMHPYIGASQPGRCRECNMELVERESALEHDHDG